MSIFFRSPPAALATEAVRAKALSSQLNQVSSSSRNTAAPRI